MKRILKGLLFAFVGVLAFTLASCGEEKSEHTPQPGWYRDSASHWHNCGHCDEQLDLAVHDYDLWVLTQGECEETRKCKTCGFVQKRNVEHTWGEWAEVEGQMQKSCERCGVSETVAQYYLKGAVAADSGIVWGASDAGKFEIDYTTMTAKLVVTLAVGDQFKVGTYDGWEFNVENVQFAEGLFEGNSDGNLVATQAADYEVIIEGLSGTDHKVKVNQLCVHTYGSWTLVSGKTCDYEAVCSKCQGKTTKVEHTLGDWALTTGKTCDYEKGCTKCDYKETKVEHAWGDDIFCDNCEAINVQDYYIKGNCLETEWAASEEGKFKVADDKKTSTYVLVLEEGDEFKVGSKDGWEFNGSNAVINVEGLSGTDNIVCEVAGVYVLTVSGLDTATHTLTIDYVQLYVRGDMNNWGTSDALEYDAETDTATITITVEAGQTFKVAPADWGLLNDTYNFGAGEEGYVSKGDNISLEAGEYVITVTGILAGTPELTIEAAE